MLKKLIISTVLFFACMPVFAQVNEYSLDPVDLMIGATDSLVQVNINIHTIEDIQAFVVLLSVTGTAGAVLDTVLTGGLASVNPPAFDPPSLVSGFTLRIINPYGIGGYGATYPLRFVAISFEEPLAPSTGVYCRLYYKVTGPGTIIFATGEDERGNQVSMFIPDTSPAAINWPAAGEVGRFTVSRLGDTNSDGTVTISDVVYLISYLFKSGPAPNPLQSGDANCDGTVTISDCVYLISYLFRSGPAPEC